MRDSGLRHFSVTLAATLLVFPFAQTAGKEPSLDQALAAPAADLIQSYLFTDMVLNGSIPMAEMGMNVYIGNEKITKRNASKKRKIYTARLEVYAEAIRVRGQASVAGQYRGIANEACQRSGSSWLGIVGTADVESISVSQDVAEINLAITVIDDGEPFTLDMPGGIVESSIVLMDPLNSDYYVIGAVFDDRIEFRPDPKVLQGWPGWARPPSKQDLENCVSELIRLEPVEAVETGSPSG